jgi:hypothetical protein
MWATFHIFTIGFVAGVLFLIVDCFERKHWYGHLLKFLIPCTAAEAIAMQFITKASPSTPDFAAFSKCN